MRYVAVACRVSTQPRLWRYLESGLESGSLESRVVHSYIFKHQRPRQCC